MVIDCHYHYYPQEFSIEKKRTEMAAAGIDKVALMGQVNEYFNTNVDHVTFMLLQFMLGKKAFEPMLKKSIANFTDTGINIQGREYSIYFEPTNDGLFAAAEAAPDILLAWVLLNPTGKINPLEELDRWQNHPAFIGVKAHPFYHHYGIEALEPIAARLEELGKPIILHIDFGQFGDVVKMAVRHPKLNIILAHTAFPEFSRAWKSIRETPNIYVDFSSFVYVSESTMKKAVKTMGAEKCLYGTDGPFGPEQADGSFDMAFMKRRFESVFSDLRVREKISGENFARLIGLS